MQSFSVFSYPGPSEPGGVSNVTLTNSVNPGEVWLFKGEEYVYVYNAGPAQINQGSFAVLSANSGFSVTVSSITGYDYPIGFVKHATITTGAYGWLLSRGFTNVNNAMASTALTTSDVLAPAAAGGVQTYVPATSNTMVPIGYVVSGCASAGTAQAYVRCFGT